MMLCTLPHQNELGDLAEAELGLGEHRKRSNAHPRRQVTCRKVRRAWTNTLTIKSDVLYTVKEEDCTQLFAVISLSLSFCIANNLAPWRI